jgi:hypothetical protein
LCPAFLNPSTLSNPFTAWKLDLPILFRLFTASKQCGRGRYSRMDIQHLYNLSQGVSTVYHFSTVQY